MSVTSLMNHRVTIQRAVSAPSRGVSKKTWSDLATDVRCRIFDKKGGVQIGAAGQSFEYDAVGYFPAATDLRPNGTSEEPDRILLSTHPVLSGVTFGVLQVSDRSGAGSHLVVYLRRRSSGD